MYLMARKTSSIYTGWHGATNKPTSIDAYQDIMLQKQYKYIFYFAGATIFGIRFRREHPGGTQKSWNWSIVSRRALHSVAFSNQFA